MDGERAGQGRQAADQGRRGISGPRVATISRVRLIVGLFVAILLGLAALFHLQMDVAVAIRVFVGGEGIWAKAQKDALLSLQRYAALGEEADHQAFQEQIARPQGCRRARLELEGPEPDMAAVRQGLGRCGLHPDDIDYAAPFFQRFQHTAYLRRAVQHWRRADQLNDELLQAAAELHRERAGGHPQPAALQAIEARLAAIDRQVRREEDQFAATLAEASRRAASLSAALGYGLAVMLAGIGALLSWPIIRRIRLTEEALVESEGRYRSIFERVSDVIYTIAPDGRFTSVSPAAERMAGWPAGEYLGRPFAEMVHPDDRELAAAIFRNTLAGHSRSGVELRIARQSGDWFDTEHSIVPLGAGPVTAVLGVARDVSERKRMETALRESEHRLRSVLEATGDGILVADAETGRFVVGNQAICEMLGYGPEELIGLAVEDIHPPEALPEVRRQFGRQLRREQRVAQNLPVKTRDGRTFLADISATPLTLGGRDHLVGVFHDVTERRRAEEEISRLACLDALTGINNRRSFLGILERDVELASRHGPGFALIMYDLDHFKEINDSHGHGVGDQILAAVTEVVRHHLRAADVLARWGGEEFLVLIAEGELATAVAVAEKLRQAIAGHRFLAVGRVTASFGVTVYQPGDEIASLLKRADEALYEAKAAGRNRVESALTTRPG